MNPTTDQPPPPPPPAQPHRSSFTCDRHPDDHFTGFCPSCLCERLTTLDQSAAASSSRKPSSATTSSAAAAALKAIFKVPGTTTAEPTGRNKTKPSFFPELRRTQSFSASKNEKIFSVFEPQRKSCDVRGRNTLWSLFNLGDDHKTEAETRNLGLPSSSVTAPVLESKEEDEHEDYDHDDDDEIRVSEEPNVPTVIKGTTPKIEEIKEIEEEIKPMKDHIDLDSHAKKPIAVSFWSAASVFSKKWFKWRQKQKLKKRNTGGESSTLPVEKPISRRYRETQSEIADYGFGRRSCDTDPRFSLDAGRISFDDPRYSFDEPRASWDGYLNGGRNFPRLPPMVSVVEDAPVVPISRSDTQIPVEEPANCVYYDDIVPGGSAQTREYYSDSRRRKSFDRSSSLKKNAVSVVAEIDELKGVSNAKVSPATIDYFHGTKLMGGERDLRDSNSNSMRDDCSETFELGLKENAENGIVGNGNGNGNGIVRNGERKGSKKSRRWNIWGFIRRRTGGNKDEDEEKCSSRVNGVERSFSESWQELRREGNGDARGFLNRRVFRSNSSVSSRNSYSVGGSFGGVRKSNVEANGNGRKRRDEFVWERNRSARFSPNHVDNGLLRFYLTPLRSSRRVGWAKSRPNNSYSIARSLWGL